VPLLPTPTQLSHPEKDALIAALTARLALADAQIAAQDARIAALEARLNELTRHRRPPATHRNRPHKAKNPTSRPLRIARRAKAAPASGARCIQIRIERSTSG
jgi:hypothetical protein